MNPRPLHIDKEGRWFHDGVEITHRKTYLLYCRHLTRDEEGRPLLRIGREQCPVEFEDTPFVVQTLEFHSTPGGPLKSIELILNDESHETLNATTLRIGAENIPYCQVREGIFEARFSRQAYQLLSPYIQLDEKKNRFFLTLAGKEYDLSPGIPPSAPAA